MFSSSTIVDDSINLFLIQKYAAYHEGEVPLSNVNTHAIIGDHVEEVKILTVFAMNLRYDAFDSFPIREVATKLDEWEHSDLGRRVMTTAISAPCWQSWLAPGSYFYHCTIRAKFCGPALTDMLLRYNLTNEL